MNRLHATQFQAILLDTDGTVTDLIQHYTGETIHVTKLTQDLIVADQPSALRLSAPTQLLHRRILLSGAQQHYLYAESFFVIERMSDYLRHELLESQVPIGVLWQREKLETFREILAREQETNEELGQYFADLAKPEFWSRRYLVYHGGAPLGLICEKFPVEYFREWKTDRG